MDSGLKGPIPGASILSHVRVGAHPEVREELPRVLEVAGNIGGFGVWNSYG